MPTTQTETDGKHIASWVPPVCPASAGSACATVLVLYALLVFAPASMGQAPAPRKVPVLESRKIWDAAPHNAFTDLVRFKDKWFCVFREGATHVSPDGKLMLGGAAARPKAGGGKTHQSMVWFSDDGRTWDQGADVADTDFWLWRVTWHDNTAYGVGYGCASEKIARLYASRDGRKFDVVVPTLF